MELPEILSKIDPLLVEANRLRNLKPEKSLALGVNALQLGVEFQRPELQVRAYLSMALTYQTLSKFTDALDVLGKHWHSARIPMMSSVLLMFAQDMAMYIITWVIMIMRLNITWKVCACVKNIKMK